jgi:Cryptococcal mannosyltransferase 1
MRPKIRHRSGDYELLPRASSDSTPSFPSLDQGHCGSPTVDLQPLRLLVRLFIRLPLRHARAIYSKFSSSRSLRRQLIIRSIYWAFAALLCLLIRLIVFTATFRPSYTRLPVHYRALQKKCQESKGPGQGNVNSEKIFIAAALYDPTGSLLGGDWSSAVLELVELLGPENVYLSIYENDADLLAKAALEALGKNLSCSPPSHTLVQKIKLTMPHPRQFISSSRASPTRRHPSCDSSIHLAKGI